MNPQKAQYYALLRGINVGGYHKVPMPELKEMMENICFYNVKTLLNSGNVVFEAEAADINALKKKVAHALEATLGFPVPVIIRNSASIKKMISRDPFNRIEINKDIKLYVTFLQQAPVESTITLPVVSPDVSFQIIEVSNGEILSVLNVSKHKTTDAMNILDKSLGKNITTRNWNTILKIGKFLKE